MGDGLAFPGVERDARVGDAVEKGDGEVPTPTASLHDLVEAAMDGGREEREVKEEEEEGLVHGVEGDVRVGDAVEKEDEEVPPPTVSLHDLVKSPWIWKAVGEVAWWAGAAAAAAKGLGRSASKDGNEVRLGMGDKMIATQRKWSVKGEWA